MSTMRRPFVRQSALSDHSALTLEAYIKKDKERFLNHCNEKLEHYENDLLRRRNEEDIAFPFGTSSKKEASKQQDNQRVTKKQDSSDGVPDSSGVSSEAPIYENGKEDLTDEQKPIQKLNGHGFLGVPKELQKSPRRTSHDLSSADEGFINGDRQKCASLSSPLNYIPEDGAFAAPTVKLNDETKSISLTGKEKGDDFRRSSGYGGSDEVLPEDEYFSSVFERSLSNNDTKPVQNGFITETVHLSNEPVSNTDGLLEFPDKIEEAFDMPSSTNGLRTGELKESSLPCDSPIWNLPDVKIKPNVRSKYKDGVNSALSPGEAGHDLSEVIRNNQHIPLPNGNEMLKTDDAVEIFYRGREDVGDEIGPLRSDGGHQGVFGQEIIDVICMSESSVPSLVRNGYRPARQVNGRLVGSDDVDGARRSNQGPEAKFSECLKRAVFCKRLRGSCKDHECVKGQMHLFHLKDSIQNGRLTDCNPQILKFLRSHNEECTECQCPLCDLFRQSESLSLEEHERFTNKLAVLTQDVLKKGTFLMVGDDGSDGLKDEYQSWKTAEVQSFRHMGDFCDSNIIRVCVRFNQQSDKVHVVVKKASQTGQNEKNVYLAIKKPSPYLVRSFWCSSELPLVCSVYHDTDFMQLQSFLYHDVTPDRCLAILRQAAKAAQYLHSLNVVYLSWKCSSLLFDNKNRSVKLCNFSHAMVLEQGVVVTSPENIRSSIDPCFAAPEVLCVGKALGFYSDVWGLGCLLYEMLHKSKPYPDCCHKSPADIREMVCKNNFCPTYPTKQLLIFNNCWQRESTERYTIDDLLKLLSGSIDVDR